MARKKARRYKLSRSSIIIAGILVLVLGSLIYAKSQKNSSGSMGNNPTNSGLGNVNLSPATSADKNDAAAAKSKDSSAASNVSGSSAAGNVIISEASQENAGADIVVKTELHGSGWSKCTVVFEQNSSKVTRQADTIYQPSFSSCLGFAISSNALPAQGPWKVSLNVSKTDGSIVSATPVYVNVKK